MLISELQALALRHQSRNGDHVGRDAERSVKRIRLSFGSSGVEELVIGRVKGVVVLQAQTESRREGSTLQEKASRRRVGVCGIPRRTKVQEVTHIQIGVMAERRRQKWVSVISSIYARH